QRWFGEKLKTQNPEEKQQLNEKISEKIEAAVEEEKGEMLPKITDKQRTQAEKRKTKYATKHPSEKIEVVVEEEKESKELDYDPHFAIRLQSELKKEFEGRGDR
ncbi:hypothetical protein KKF61_08420, partial [Patescibacteria group bacterium]|nr:hypothetical protein [Patescibacteria group bacterium]